MVISMDILISKSNVFMDFAILMCNTLYFFVFIFDFIDDINTSDISVAMNVYTHIGFDDAEEELKQMEEFIKVQVEYNNSMLSQMGNLSQISKIAYTPAMDVARELSERNQQFANLLGINRMSGETVDTDKEDDDKGKDENP